MPSRVPLLGSKTKLSLRSSVTAVSVDHAALAAAGELSRFCCMTSSSVEAVAIVEHYFFHFLFPFSSAMRRRIYIFIASDLSSSKSSQNAIDAHIHPNYTRSVCQQPSIHILTN